MPKISVITPVYNIAEHLPRFFNSMLAQSFSDFKLLIFDDGSVDDSISICEKYSHKDHRISVFKLEHSGVTKTRNTALDYVDSEFIVFADGDDYVEPDYLTNLFDAINKTGADLVISNVIYNSEGSEHIDATFPKRGFQIINRSDFKNALPTLIDDRRLNYLYAKIYRSEKLKKIRIDNCIKIGEDTMINIQYLNYTNTIATIDNTDYHYIKYQTRSITSQYDPNAFENYCLINNYILNQLDKQELLSKEAIDVIDNRILTSAIWTIDKLLSIHLPFHEKSSKISEILNSKVYLESYNRQKHSKNSSLNYILPQSGEKYLIALRKKESILKIKSKILNICPRFIVNLYHKIKGVP